jgi:hypothetical protein
MVSQKPGAAHQARQARQTARQARHAPQAARQAVQQAAWQEAAAQPLAQHGGTALFNT